MEFRRVCYALVYVILLCALATWSSSEGKRSWPVDLSQNHGGDIQLLPSMEEQVQSCCRESLINGMNIEEFRSCISQCSSLKPEQRTENVNIMIKLQPLHLKRYLFECMEKRSVWFPGLEDKLDSTAWLMKCTQTTFIWPISSRRFLVGKPQAQVALSAYPVQVPIPGQARSSSQAPGLSSYGSLPATSASAISQIHDLLQPSPPPKSSSHPNDSSQHTDSMQKQQIIAAAIASGAAILLILIMCFCCVRGKRNKVDPKEGHKDDHPLLNLTITNFSAGSSRKAVSLENKELSISNGKHPYLAPDVSMKSEVHDSAVAKGLFPVAVPTLPLKPSPGRSTPPPPTPPVPPPPPPAPTCTSPPLPAGPFLPDPPKLAQPPPLPKKGPGKDQVSPLRLNCSGKSGSNVGGENDVYSEGPKAKLKPFFWDKVLANPNQSMVWHEIRAGSFQFDEEMIESLFGCNNIDKNKTGNRRESLEPPVQYIRIIDSKKAQNLSILLKALDVTTDEVVDALREGNELPIVLLQTLLKMAPTIDEELKLRLFTGDLKLLGPAERFLKVLVDIPFAFKRLESIHYITTIPDEFASVKESLTTLKVASNKLRESRLFMKLLEAVLKTGNRMNDGTYRGGAQAFRLDTLLKLSDVKGTDGKTTLLHFVVQEIIRSEGRRAVHMMKANQDLVEHSSEELEEQYHDIGLQVLSGLSNELEDVKKAALIDAEELTSTVSKLGQSLKKTKDFLNSELKNLDEDHGFQNTVAGFVNHFEDGITWLIEEERRIAALVMSTADYFHGHARREEGLRLFMIVRDFLLMLDKVCKEVKDTTSKIARVSIKESPGHTPSSSSPHIHQTPLYIRQRLVPAILERRMVESSSDDENPSA